MRFLWLSLAVSLLACSPAAAPLTPFVPPTDGFVRSDRARLRDQAGRVLVFRGVNVRAREVFDVTLDPARCPPPTDVLEELPALTDGDLARMRAIGLSVIRLPINWSGIEPEEGMYDEAYLDRVADLVARADAHALRVLLDFHQDAWGKDVGEDGAPLWAYAPQPGPEDLLCGPLGDTLEGRRTATLPYFTGFFGDAGMEESGPPLQQAFARMAAHVAERFEGEPAVLGYDLFNEPLPSDAQIDRFHARLAPAIRAVDARHLLFFEPSALRNLTETGPRPAAPFPDDGGVYAVHLYSLSFSDPRNELDTIIRARLEPNVTRAASEAALFDAPLFVGEWGIRPDSPGSASYVRFMYELFDRELASATVWVWKESSQGAWGFYDYDEAADAWTERPLVVSAHARVVAEAIAGEPISMSFDPDARRFELVYEGRSDLAPHVLHLPEAPLFPADFAVTCDGMALARPMRDARTGRVEVVCAGAGTHTLVLTGAR